jgi:indolepyruvate ferredoxin oxidoreductase alpha subunit
LALGAYHAGVGVATSYPGTPSTEILESIAHFKDIYAEWSTNEKVAMEVGMGAAYAGARAMVSMKHVGLNVASDPFTAASMTGVNAGLVVVCADDPGIHSSQNEQDNRYYAKLAKVPLLEPSDSQEAYDIMEFAFSISEKFDTPVLVRTTTRISHAKALVRVNRSRWVPTRQIGFQHDMAKYVMLPGNARSRHLLVETRLLKLSAYSEDFPLNYTLLKDRHLGVVTSGVAYQYAREVFPGASFLKLTMTYPLPEKLIRYFANHVDQIIVIEELEGFLQESINAIGIKAIGKEFIPHTGELTPSIIEKASQSTGLLPAAISPLNDVVTKLPPRPPLLCPGCPHTGIFFVLSTLGKRIKLPGTKEKAMKEPKFTVTGDIGCYTLAAYPPMSAIDTTACMGAGIGQALGMEKAGISNKVVAVIGDSTFIHSGITSLVNAVYNDGKITVIILDNSTTAMTGHQEHPGTGISAQGKKTTVVELEQVVSGIGVTEVKVIDAFNISELREGVRSSLNSPKISVIIVRGACPVRVRRSSEVRDIDIKMCNRCAICLQIGCPAIQSEKEWVRIEPSLCAGEACNVCQQICPQQAIGPLSKIEAAKSL